MSRLIVILLLTQTLLKLGFSEAEEPVNSIQLPKSDILQKIEGRVSITSEESSDWMATTRVCLDGGLYCGFLQSSGDFVIHNVPPGSYLVEVHSRNHVFDPVRVDISSKNGKIRARKVNLLKPAAVSQIPYPLRFRTEKQAAFFEKRESWNILDTLKNPMVLLLVAPLIIMMILPRMMKGMDPESQKEMQNSMNMFQQPGSSMPSMEEFFTNMFGGGSTKTAKKPAKVVKRRDKH